MQVLSGAATIGSFEQIFKSLSMQKYLLIFLFASLSASAQKATIKKIELSGEKIIVYYDLEDDNPNNEYQMNLK